MKITPSHNQLLSNPKELIINASELQKAYILGRRNDVDLHTQAHLYLEYVFSSETIEIETLRQAVGSLLKKYPILLAQFNADGNILIKDHSVDTNLIVTEATEFKRSSIDHVIANLREDFLRADPSAFNLAGIVVKLAQFEAGAFLQINLNLMLLDGFSVRVILAELSKAYQNGGTSIGADQWDELQRLQHITSQYKNLPAYQRAHKFWLEKIPQLPSEPIFPLKKAIGTRRSNLVRRKFVLDKTGVTSLKVLAAEYSIPLSSFILAVFGFVLSNWAREKRFYITVLTQYLRAYGRGELADTLGNLAGTCIVDLDYSGAINLEDRLPEINNAIFKAMTRSATCGLEVLQQKNKLEQAAGRAASPVAFVSMLQGEDDNIPDELFMLEGKACSFVALETPQVLLDHQVISRPDGGISFVLDGMDEAFEAGVVEAIYAAYENLITNIVVNKKSALNRACIDLRPTSQRINHQQYNLTNASIEPECLHEAFYRTAQRFPAKLCVIDGSIELTYEEMRQKVNGLAALLRQQGVQPGDLVAVYLSKSWFQMLSVLAIVAAGGAYVPIDPQQPYERKAHILAQCDCKVVLSLSKHGEDKAISALTLISLDRHEQLKSQQNLATIQRPTDLAYIIFTSGSTGIPKGVALDNLGPHNTIEDINTKINLTENDVLFGISELNFDLSVYDIFGAIAVGACLVVPPPDSAKNPEICVELIQKYRVSVWNSVPALASLIFEYAHAKKNLLAFSSIRHFLLSGDWIPISLPMQLRSIGAQVLSLGGATEASIWSIFYPVDKVSPCWNSIPYGYPLKNQTFYVLDEALNLRPDGVPGELYIGGVGLAREYWQDTLRTQKSFITHPTMNIRLYKTGDWGVMRPDGYIEFLGRIDGQVKIRGYRIELGEIEATLLKKPGIKNVAAVIQNKGQQDAYIALYFVSDQLIPTNNILDFLAQYLPNYMLPSKVMRLNTLPLSANGKLDKLRLPSPDSEAVASHNYIAPRTSVQKAIAHIWSDLLKVEQVGLEDVFFELGGNSFDAVRMVTQAGQYVGRDVALSVLLKNPRLDKFCDNMIDDVDPMQYLVNLGGKGHPLFLFHPSGGNVACYRMLADALGDSYEVMGISSTLSDDVDRAVSLNNRVERYIAEVKRYQSSGPYYLAGWSMGGVLAFEAARQLINLGESIALLVILDSPPPIASKMPNEVQMVRWFYADLLEMDDIPVSETLKTFSAVTENLVHNNYIQARDHFVLGQLYQSFYENMQILTGYSAKPLDIDCPIYLAIADRNVEHRVAGNAEQVWRSLLPRHVAIDRFNCTHYEVVKKPVINRASQFLLANTPDESLSSSISALEANP